MLRRRLSPTDLAEGDARVLEVEIGEVLSLLALQLRRPIGELRIGEHVARAERLRPLQRNGGRIRARPLALEIRVAPRRARRSVGLCRDEADDGGRCKDGGNQLTHRVPFQ
jgi:hypothetical protein